MNHQQRLAQRTRQFGKLGTSYEYGQLESRNLLAGITLETFNGFATVIIDGTSENDTSLVQNVTNNTITVSLNGQQETYSRTDVERIRFLGRSGDDTFTNNTDTSSAAFGHDGNDTLRGGDGNNWIQGGNGNDSLFGGERNDNLRGRSGDDFIDPGRRHDRALGGSGADTIVGSHGNDFIRGGEGNDTLRGGDGVDRIFGGVGDDTIDGGNDLDRLFGEAGHDEIFGRQGDDVINGGVGNDQLNGNIGADTIEGGAGNDVIFGESGNDQISGGSGADSITGGGGDDAINFGSGTGEFAILDGAFGDYSVSSSGITTTLIGHSANDGSDTLTNAETISFENIDRQASDFDADLNEAETESLRLLNQLRTSMNLSPLSAVRDLSDFAEDWSQNTLPFDFRHTTSDEITSLIIEGRTFYGENIVFLGDPSMSATEIAQSFHNTWLGSTTHFDNMVDTRWTEIGVGLIRLSSGWYGTHNFSNS